MKLVASALFVAITAGSAFASDISTVNAFRYEGRNWGDFNGLSSLSMGPAAGPYAPQPGVGPFVTAQGPFSAGVRTIETFPAGIGGGAQHEAYFSADGGASRFKLHGGGEGATHLGQSFVIDVDITMSGGPTAPRREGGIKFRNDRPNNLNGSGQPDPFVDEGLFMVASDGEVAIFGAAMPFTGFGPSAYTFGTTGHMHFEYYAPGVMDPVLGAYSAVFTDAVTGVHSSGLKIWGTEADGTKGFNSGTEIGFHNQGFNNLAIPGGMDIMYGSPVVTPAPGALALLGVGGLVATRRRR